MICSHVVDRLRSASFALCDQHALQVRLENAYAHLAQISSLDFPRPLAARFEELVADLCYGADTVREALVPMNPIDQGRLAERIVSLYADLCRYLPAEE